MSSSTAPRALILCADDYALHPAVDAAVEQLTLAGRLSATSCMTTSPRWIEAAPRLQALRPRLSVGLHFNLTESHGGAAPAQALATVIRQAYTGAWSVDAMRSMWTQQLDAFETALGTPPDFIDGHQHVHQLPGFADAMLHVLQQRYTPAQMPWVRSTAPIGTLWRSPKATIIALLGGWQTTRRLRQAGIVINQGFGGVYGFDAPTPEGYGAQMAQWLAQVHNGSLLMCHPATAEVAGDAIGAQRPVEFAYLMSDAFGTLLQAQQCQIQQGPLMPLLKL
ncbi:ChbG/HpnK family deacetylase [Comamonas sp.]|uniref:ChbG/HpnK family deacetylase n=1 Tax=Comamonas sp. TaxID=34028 RepID=UPI00289A3081|nr:ChbG/HpnK family deacetylase [Comamonas sp.]